MNGLLYIFVINSFLFEIYLGGYGFDYLKIIDAIINLVNIQHTLF